MRSKDATVSSTVRTPSISGYRRPQNMKTFDIFSGYFQTSDPTWLIAVQGFEQAYQQMRALAAAKPGPYFIFGRNENETENRCLASVDTSRTHA